MTEAYEHGDAEGVSVCNCLLLDLIDLSLPSEIKLWIVGESARLAREAQRAFKHYSVSLIAKGSLNNLIRAVASHISNVATQGLSPNRIQLYHHQYVCHPGRA